MHFAPGINWPRGLRRTILYIFRGGTCVSETQMKGSGSEGEGMGAGQDEVGGVGRGGKLSMMCWNVGGWGKRMGAIGIGWRMC